MNPDQNPTQQQDRRSGFRAGSNPDKHARVNTEIRIRSGSRCPCEKGVCDLPPFLSLGTLSLLLQMLPPVTSHLFYASFCCKLNFLAPSCCRLLFSATLPSTHYFSTSETTLLTAFHTPSTLSPFTHCFPHIVVHSCMIRQCPLFCSQSSLLFIFSLLQEANTSQNPLRN